MYEIFLSERLASIDLSDFKAAALKETSEKEVEEHKSEEDQEGKEETKTPTPSTVMVEEIEDKDEKAPPLPTVRNFILEEAEKELESPETQEMYHSSKELTVESWEDIPPPLPELTPFLLRPKRKCHPGLSAQGVSVLSVKGYIHDMENGRIDLHLDSCTNITLISKEFYKGLINKPSLKTGS